MITYYQKTIKDTKLKTAKTFKVGSWVAVENPSEDEMTQLAKTFALEVGHLKDAIDPFEVPRLEVEGSNIYIYTRVPGSESGQVETMPLLLVLGKDFVMTVTRKSLPVFKRFTTGSVRFNTTQKTKFFLQVFSAIMDTYSAQLTTINRKVRALSVHLEQISNKDIIQFVGYERVLNDYVAALIPTNTILRNLLSGKYFRLYEEDEDLIEDLMLSNGQLIEACTSNLKTMVNVREAYSTIMTNNLNRVIRVLTALTILLTIPTMIASFYGMNVPLPGNNTPEAFWWILGVTSFVTLFLLGIFTRNRWL